MKFKEIPSQRQPCFQLCEQRAKAESAYGTPSIDICIQYEEVVTYRGLHTLFLSKGRVNRVRSNEEGVPNGA
jgi:hypothetical protein